jgi:DNA phosphorothioation-dependent restriction protein DptG
MDSKAWNEAERRRVDKFREIMRLVSTTLGPDADLEQETMHAIEQWEETVEMDIDPLAPTNALQALLREYHDICDEILKSRTSKSVVVTNTQSGKSRATAPAKTVAGVPRPKEKTRGSYRQQNGCDISFGLKLP